MPELSQSDFDKAVRYLEDAAKFYSRSTSTRYLNRARLIRLLALKLTRNNNPKKIKKQ